MSALSVSVTFIPKFTELMKTPPVKSAVLQIAWLPNCVQRALVSEIVRLW